MNRQRAVRATAEMRQAAVCAVAAVACHRDVPAAAAGLVAQLRALESWAARVDVPMQGREAVTTAAQVARQLHRLLAESR